MSILDDLPLTSITVEKKSGAGSVGDIFAAPVTRSVFIEDKRRQIRDNQGQLTLAESTLYDDDLTQSTLYEPGSKVTADGRPGRVIRCAINRIGDADVDHLAIYVDHLSVLS